MTVFVVCHGAWSAGWAWKKVRPLVQQAGHQIFIPTYSGLGERAHLSAPTITLDTHIQDVVSLLFYEDLYDVVLVGHSYGGMVATGVADKTRERIARLIYVDAFVPQNGQSLNDLVSKDDRAKRVSMTAAQGDSWLLAPNPTPADTSHADITWITARRRWQPIGTFNQPIALQHLDLEIPRSYIYCTRKTSDDPFGKFAAAAKSDPRWSYYDIDASHSPNVTAPDELVRILLSIAAGKA